MFVASRWNILGAMAALHLEVAILVSLTLLRMAHWAVAAHGNADALVGALVKYGKEHGHNSIYLHMLES